MSENAKQMSGPDLAAGVAITDIADGVMLQGHVGEEMELLVEGSERGKWMGRTRGNKIVFFPADDLKVDRTGQLITVRIEEAGPWSMQGQPVRVINDTPQALKDLLKAKNRRFTFPLTPITPVLS